MAIEILHRADLRARGYSRRMIAAAVAGGDLIRARRDHYLPGGCPDDVVRAVRVGGRLTCLSLLAAHGVFVASNRVLHVHMLPSSARMRSPHDRWRPLEPRGRRSTRLHWLGLSEPVGSSPTVGVVDALAHAVLCQHPRDAVATLDSAINGGLIDPARLGEVFALLPAKYAVLRPLVDGRAESGPETLVRLLLRSLGCRIELQVTFVGVGRVDLVIDGWLAIECDSERHHGEWRIQERDRRRDAALAARGMVTLRPTARMIMSEPELVLAAVRGLLATRSSASSSGPYSG